MHKCRSGSVISSIFLCDGNFDCGENDTSDEENCTCIYAAEAEKKKCKLICSGDYQCKHSFLFTGEYNTYDQNIRNYSDLAPLSQKFTCYNGDFVDLLLVDDLVTDCKGGEDEKRLQNLFDLTKYINVLNQIKYHAGKDIQNASILMKYVSTD